MVVKRNSSKNILSAGIIREIIFDDEKAYNRWVLNLTGATKVLSKEVLDNGNVYTITIQYYGNIKLFDVNLLRGIKDDNKE